MKDNQFDTTSLLLLSLLVIACSILVVDKVLRVKQDAKEPPFIPTIIPYFGHIIGLFWNKHPYYAQLSARYHFPIYSLAMAGGRIYVVNSPDLVLCLQRQPKTVSFWFIEAKFTAILGGMSREASEKVLEGVRGEPAGGSLLIEGLKAIHTAMMPGEGVNQMVLVAVQMIATAIETFERDKKVRRIDLWKWSQHLMTMVTTESVYGPMNPYQDPEIERGFWDFADDTIMLLAELMPTVLASKGFTGREKVVSSLERYFAANGHEAGSGLVKARFQSLKRDIALKDIARFECVNGIAILSNTVPTTFWTMYHVFSNPSILQSVRDQVHAIVTTNEEHGQVHRTIDLSKLKDVPILASIIQESLRHRASGAGTRIVLEDVLLDDRYLLKKDSYLIIPNHEMHFDTHAWGETVNDFDAQRFIKSDSKKVHSGAFRGFGGGINRCPGRLFAMTEIMALVAIFALRYDMIPASGQWLDPEQDTRNMSLAIGPPKKKVLVDIVPRKGWEGGSWAFSVKPTFHE